MFCFFSSLTSVANRPCFESEKFNRWKLLPLRVATHCCEVSCLAHGLDMTLVGHTSLLSAVCLPDDAVDSLDEMMQTERAQRDAAGVAEVEAACKIALDKHSLNDLGTGANDP